jgi:hypothetical protein
MKIRLLLPLVFFLLASHLYGQPCKDFHKSNDCYVYVPLDRDFQIYNQARSSQTEVGQTNIYKVILYGRKDFIVGVCAEAAFYRKIHFRIVDSQTKKVLYDNKDFDYVESFSFTVEKTQPLDLEVTVLPKDNNSAKGKVCVGLQILWSNPEEPKKK